MNNFKVVMFILIFLIGCIIIGFTSLLPITVAVVLKEPLWLLLYLGVPVIMRIEILIVSMLLALFD